ncbi:MAG: hypothetical protein A2021_00520 [Elusimicrobia bacterium GWF2_52_66]|nr:MAG: hypothetical protein A2X33_06155 [Elusimicrobia bacterium GWA2_51_34]OGR85212.1 MAG: hypothetical protein A2021_00520 [Elusimicrobia bacterium GWF2_52_66]HAF94748.1 hypothetical protein [Elusimicrobiota bacterium]HCE97642.1 hypothetical protein [Elusimicrobiota bacterium]
MKNIASTAGWLLLAAVLAVPSFLFYNWWAKNKEKAVSERAQKMNAGAIFQPPAPAAGAGDTPESGGRTVSQEQAAIPASTHSAPATASGVSAQAVLTNAAVPAAAAVSTRSEPISYFSPKSPRNPTMSPMEYQQIKSEEYQRAEAERQRLAALQKRKKETSIETKMRLQGIVGNAVIINGDMYNVGQKILGAKILKIGVNYFIGEHKGRQFKVFLR